MDELKKQIMDKTGFAEKEAQTAIQTVVTYLKKRLPDPIPLQIDVVLAGIDGREQTSRLFEAIGAPVGGGGFEVTKLILGQGIDTNVRNTVGETPLHVAAFCGREEITKLLLDRGADINAKNSHGEVPLVVAARAINVNQRVVELLRKAGSKVDIYAACLIGGKDVLLSLLEESPELVNIRKGFREETPLHAAASKGHVDIVELLIDSGANIEVKNNQGDTPLHLASLNGETLVVDLLIAKGAHVNPENTLGATPLDSAIYNVGAESDVVELLYKHGATKGDID